MEISVTRMSVKGQVVIPKDARDEAGLKESDKLLVYASDEGIFLKKMDRKQAWKEMDDILRKMDQRNIRLSPTEIQAEIDDVRKEKKTAAVAKTH